jgi:anaerobic magnesium-protoporphyrin IX monomethyl ester cyclase
MKIVLIEPAIMDSVAGSLIPIALDAVPECPSYGIYLLANLLRQAGHEVVLIDLIAQGSHSLDRYHSDLDECSLVGIGATSMSWATALDVIRQIRQRREDLPIVLGGIHPTMFDRYILQRYPIQFIVRGEGERALPALCRALETGGEPGEIPNLSWRSRDGTIVRNPTAPKISREDLGSYALPDYSTLPQHIYKSLSIESSRGCAFDCSFCSTQYRKGWRGIPPERFVDRLETIMQHLDRTRYGTVHIIDDEFSMDPRRASEIARIIRRRGLRPRLVSDSRATDLLYDGYLENIAEFTCQFLVGAESGYDEGLKLIGKGTTCKVLESAASRLEQYGIAERADFSFILGLPWETKAEVEKTIRFAMHLYGTYGVRILLQWYCQIPGSRLWEEDRRQQLVNETMYDDYGFFRNLYLFRTGVRLTPKEIWEIGDLVSKFKWVAKLHHPNRRMIEFVLPPAIFANFPRELVQDEDSGLVSLRQLARPGSDGKLGLHAPTQLARHEEATPALEVGIPRRHFVGYQ